MIPPLDPGGALAAALSAAVFIVAIVYVVRSGHADIQTPLMSALAGEDSLLGRELFSNAILERRFAGRGLLLSIALHALVLLGTPLLPYLFPDRLNFDFRKYNVKIVEFRIPEPLLYTAPDAKPSRSRKRAEPPGHAATGRTSSLARASRATGSLLQKVAARPRLQLPSSAQSRARDVIIEPDQPPQLSIAAPHPLPTAFLWAQAPAPDRLSRLVGEPPAVNLPRFALPHSTPAVQRPNREVALAELQIASGPVLTERPPQLPVLPANISPVRMPSPPIDAPGQLPASSLPGSSPFNLIALMQTPAPPAPAYLLQAGNRLAEAHPGSNGPSQGASGGNDTPGANANASETAKNVPKAPDAEADANARSDMLEAGTALSQGTYADLLAASSPGSAGKGPSASDSTAGQAGEQARSKASGQSYPSGNLGVIIVQQSAQDTILEGSEVLTGQPIYTVYFDVPGAPRRWILQYCVPGSDSKTFFEQPDGVIRILPKRSVQPPFPIERIPLDVKSVPNPGTPVSARRLVIYATVNERGETGNVRLIRGTGQEIDRTAMATLQRWTFRPAMRGDTPVAVEALFGIPLP